MTVIYSLLGYVCHMAEVRQNREARNLPDSVVLCKEALHEASACSSIIVLHGKLVRCHKEGYA